MALLLAVSSSSSFSSLSSISFSSSALLPLATAGSNARFACCCCRSATDNDDNDSAATGLLFPPPKSARGETPDTPQHRAAAATVCGDDWGTLAVAGVSSGASGGVAATAAATKGSVVGFVAVVVVVMSSTRRFRMFRASFGLLSLLAEANSLLLGDSSSHPSAGIAERPPLELRRMGVGSIEGMQRREKKRFGCLGWIIRFARFFDWMIRIQLVGEKRKRLLGARAEKATLFVREGTEFSPQNKRGGRSGFVGVA